MEDRKQKKGIKPGIVIALVVCVIAVCSCVVFGMYMVMNKKAPASEDTTNNIISGSNIVITEDSRISASDISQKVNDSMIVVKMTGEWTFNSDCSSSNAYLANSDKNNYPLRFEITMQDTGEVILTTPDVPVGACIQDFGLPNKLASGTYNVVVAHQAVKDGEVFSTVRTAAKIIVK